MMNEGIKKSRVLLVAAHSDDEVLGCGGTLCRHQKNGDEVHFIFLTNGVGSRGSDDGASKRAKASLKVAERLAINSTEQFDFPDNRLDTVPILEIAKIIESKAKLVMPDIIYTHHAGDLNVDHRICSEAVSIAFRSIPGSSFLKIFGFEVQSSTEWSPRLNFNPNHFVNIAAYLEEKKRLLALYEEEIREFPHPRSLEAIEALAKWRGSISGFKAAEAFVTLNSRWP